MRNTAIIIATFALAASSAQAQQDCRNISDAASRLACFDKQPPKNVAKKMPGTSPATSKGSAAPAATDTGWHLLVIKDNFNDKTACVISPIDRPWVQISVGNLYVDFRKRGGVEGFTTRLDDNPPGQMQLPTPIDKSISMVHLKDDAFYEAMAGHRLRISTFTVLRTLSEEDLNLEPAKRLYKKMGPECEK